MKLLLTLLAAVLLLVVGVLVGVQLGGAGDGEGARSAGSDATSPAPGPTGDPSADTSSAPSTVVSPAPQRTRGSAPDREVLGEETVEALDRLVAGMRRALDDAAAPAESSSGEGPEDFVLSVFNVLGSSHTAPGGNKRGWELGHVRMEGAAELLARHGIEVVGFQELQRDQLRKLDQLTEGRFRFYPGMSLGSPHMQDSLAWRTDTWQLLRADHVEIPYFKGQRKQMPVVLLRHRVTGYTAVFANFHNPASTRWAGNQQHWRDIATDREIALVNRLVRETGVPVLVTGDMNEKREYFCRMTGEAPMVAAQGGSNGAVCRPPRVIGVEWIFGSKGVEFSHYTIDRSPLVRRTTDHPVVLVRVRMRD